VNCGVCWADRVRSALQAAGLAALLALWALPSQAAEASPCRLRGVEHAARCGQLQRALDPAAPQGQQIGLHYAVLPALARNSKSDPVFFVVGGPGQSAIALAGTASRLLARFGMRRDIVLVDQRGTGRSAPLSCGDEAAVLPLRDAVDPASQLQRAIVCLARLQALSHGDLRHYTSSIAAADLDAVRQALGAERINLVAVSYGTRVALEYQRLFPRHVRRVVLDGVAPPDMLLPQASATDAQAAFDALLKACDRDAACRSRHPRLAEQWRALLASLPRELPVVHPHTGRSEPLMLQPEMLQSMLRSALYAPLTASALPAALQEAADGRLGALAALSSALGSRRGADALALGQHFSVICSEDMQLPPAQPTPDFGRGLAPLYEAVCAAWPRAALPPGFRDLPPASAAVLLLSGGIDPATPPRHGERVARALGPKSRHEVVPNAGHGLLGVPCVHEAVFRFVDAADDAAALQVDAACARDLPRPPVFVPPGAAP
jgi:pimeloyl-ACP methyl ester carboxylesterase